MKQFLIYTNVLKDKNLEMTARVEKYLMQHGHRYLFRTRDDGWIQEPGAEKEYLEALKQMDGMLVLGGDGTILQAVRDTKGSGIPILGVNLGTLGYMTEVEPDTLEESLDKLLEGSYELESRMMLNAKVSLHGEIREGWALNDIVINRHGSLHTILYRIYVNGQLLRAYNADGIIITTPTGSTGYNLSAGGPIVEPKAKLIVLTPVCPHTLNQRSIILSPEDEVVVEIPQARDGGDQEVEINFDGGEAIRLHAGDSVRIQKSEKITEFIKLDQVSFLDVLHRKLSDT